MRGLVGLFLAILLVGVIWKYLSVEEKSGTLGFIKKHFFTLVLAILAVAVATFYSTNFTLRIV